jgi:hypothetical protein
VEAQGLVLPGPLSTWSHTITVATGGDTTVATVGTGLFAPLAISLAVLQSFNFRINNNGGGGTSLTASIDQVEFWVT